MEGFEGQQLEKFLLHVAKMRTMQQKYFQGDKKILAQCKRQESIVDTDIVTLLMRFDIKLADLEKKYEQTNLF